eukprot:comp10528_c0_seq2/m.12835 comp10528_c0_seq2/g.12835  ORF comp10528_c0_seq2/g.12835 comp10528_c0_seq2/m.12835 type:complete len:251 (+) comp10528_c0_seq2:24-776(+)
MGVLSKEQVEFFSTNGFLIIPSFWSENTLSLLRSAVPSLIQESETPVNKTVFDTGENQTSVTDQYFLESGDRMRIFYEEKAVDPVSKNLLVEKHLAINKIGHNIHELHPAFRAVTIEDERVFSICSELGYEDPRIAQSMFIFKQREIGGKVAPHVDGTFLYTEPQSVLGFWWPLDQCSVSNGCLWAVKGSHVNGVDRFFRRTNDTERQKTNKLVCFDPENAPEFNIVLSDISPFFLIPCPPHDRKQNKNK